MYQVGECVLYGIHGVCAIIGTEIRNVDRKKVEYFVLEPMDHPGTRFYVPTGNQVALSKLKKILTAQELERLLKSEEAKRDCWIQDENQRKQHYRELINSGDRAALISMVRTLHAHKQAQAAAGRKFHLADDNFLRDAEKLLNAEFSLVLNIPSNQVAEYIIERTEK